MHAPTLPWRRRNRGDGSPVVSFYAACSTSPADAAVAPGPIADGQTTKDDDHGSDGDGATPRRLGEGAGHRVHGRRPGRRPRGGAGPPRGGPARRWPRSWTVGRWTSRPSWPTASRWPF